MAAPWRDLVGDDAVWLDTAAGLNPASGFMQSGFWAEFKGLEGYEVTRLIFEPGGERLGGASLLRFQHGNDRGFVLCPEGPVLPWNNADVVRAALRSLMDAVKNMPGSLGLRIEPHLPTPLPSVLRNWGDAPTDLTPEDTLVLDLGLDEAELLAKAHSKCRYNLRIADREGIEVVRTQDMDSVHEFYPLILETANRTGFFVEPLAFFLNLLSVGFRHGAIDLFCARFDGELLASIVVVYFGRRATYLYGASSSRNRNKMPSYPLHRAAMAEARRRGCVEYDMYGIDAFERRDHLYAGITRFKKQWGGAVQRRIGARDCVFYDRLAELMVGRLQQNPEL